VNAWLWVYAIPRHKTNDDRPFGRAPGRSSTTINIVTDRAEFEAETIQTAKYGAELPFAGVFGQFDRLDAPAVRPY